MTQTLSDLLFSRIPMYFEQQTELLIGGGGDGGCEGDSSDRWLFSHLTKSFDKEITQ